MIKTFGLTKKYGSLTALDSIDLTFPKGNICGVLGPNGAGKTTLFKILCGLTSYEGRFDIESKRQKPIGAIIEKPKLYGYMNMYDNLRLFAGIQGVEMTKGQLENVLKTVGLPAHRTDPVKHFSMGMKQRLGIAIALINDPDILILDEPFSGLDPVGVREFRLLIAKLVAEENLTVLISSHLLFELENLCDQLVILREGKVYRTGKMDELTTHASHTYRIAGEGLADSIALKARGIAIRNNSVAVELSPEEANKLLRELMDEGMLIHKFTPLDAIERYFDES
jgi:ABC-type multidrug transport system ATPase subunit